MQNIILLSLQINYVSQVEINKLEDEQLGKSEIRDFQYMTLNNGLKVMYVEDPKSTTQTSLTQKFGSFYDPSSVVGLANALNHLHSFHGEQQSDKVEFHTILRALNGSSSVFSNREYSNFAFEIDIRDDDQEQIIHKQETLIDSFVKLFTNPIISIESIDNAVEHLNSNFENSFVDSNYMWDSIVNYILEEHPLSRLDCGNKYTLQNQIEDKQLLIDVFDYQRKLQYDAENAALVIISPIPYEKLIQIIEETFNKLPYYQANEIKKDFRTKQANSEFLPSFELFEDKKQIWENKMPIINEFSALEVKISGNNPQFIVQNQLKINQSMPNNFFMRFIMSLILDPNEGSFKQYLKQKHGIEKLNIDFNRSFLEQMILTLQIELSKEKLLNEELINDTLDAQFKQYEYLSNLDKDILRSKQEYWIKKSCLQFDYPEIGRELKNTIDYSSMIVRQGFESLKFNLFKNQNFDYSLQNEFFKQLLQSKTIILLSRNDNSENQFNKKSKQFKADYLELCVINNLTNICDSQNKQSITFNKFYDNYLLRRNLEQIDPVNKFNFEIKNNIQIDNLDISNNQFKGIEYSIKPIKLTHDKPDQLNIYYLQEGQQNQPKSHFNIQINTNYNLDSNQDLSKIYFEIITSYIQTNLLKQLDLGQEIYLTANQFGICITIQGQDKWINEILIIILEKITKYEFTKEYILEKINQVINVLLFDQVQDNSKKGPVYFDQLFVKQKRNINLQLEHLQKLKNSIANNDLSEFNEQIRNLSLNIGSVDILCVGTMSKDNLYQNVNTLLKYFNKFDSSKKLEQRIARLNNPITEVQLNSNNLNEKLNVQVIGQQIEYSKSHEKNINLSKILSIGLNSRIQQSLREKFGKEAYVLVSPSKYSVMIKIVMSGENYPIYMMKQIQEKWLQKAIILELFLSLYEFDLRLIKMTEELCKKFPNLLNKGNYLFRSIISGEKFTKLDDLCENAKFITKDQQNEFLMQVYNDAYKLNFLLDSNLNENSIDTWTQLEDQDRLIQKMGQQSVD